MGKAKESKRRFARENMQRRLTKQDSVTLLTKEKAKDTDTAPSTLDKPSKKDPGWTLDQMGFCLRSMALPAGELGHTASDLAEELESLASLQRKIGKLQAMEHERQEEILERCDKLFTHLNMMCKTPEQRRSIMIRKIFKDPPKNSEMEPAQPNKGTSEAASAASQSCEGLSNTSVPEVDRGQRTASAGAGSDEDGNQEGGVVGIQGAT